MAIMTHAKFHFSRLMLTLSFGIPASELPRGPGERLKGPGLIGLIVLYYTLFCRIRECDGARRPPPPLRPIILNDETNSNRLYIIGKGIYWRVRFILDIDKIFWFRDFMSDFRKIVKFRPFLKFENISNSWNLDMLYIILRYVNWRIRLNSLLRKIFKYRKNISNNRFREIQNALLNRKI